jgi:MFS family permease
MKSNPWFIFSVLLLGIFVALEANAFTTPALPYISEYFGISISNSGILTLFASGAAIALAPFFGRLGDQVGRKKVIVSGLVIFILAQSMKVITPFVSVYIIGSLLQGVGYALIFPNVFAYIPELFKEHKRGKAIGLFMLFSYIATGTGGVIAGALVDNWGWRSVYIVSASISTVGLILISMFVPSSSNKQKSELDYKGVSMFMLIITTFVSLPLIYSNYGTIWLSVGLGVTLILLLIFLRLQKRVKFPLLDLKLLKLRGVYIPSILIAAQNFMMLSILMSLTFLASDIPGMNALQVGMITTVLFSTAAILAPIIGSMLDRYNPVYLVFVSLGLGFVGIILYMTINTNSSLISLLTVMAFVGGCSSLLNASLMKIVINFTPDDKKGVGTGTFSLFKDLGLPIGSTLGMTIYGTSTSSGMDSSLKETATELGLNSEQTTLLLNSKHTGESSAELDGILSQFNVQFADLINSANAESVSFGIQVMGSINITIFIIITILSLGLLKMKRHSNDILNVQSDSVDKVIN